MILVVELPHYARLFYCPSCNVFQLRKHPKLECEFPQEVPGKKALILPKGCVYSGDQLRK